MPARTSSHPALGARCFALLSTLVLLSACGGGGGAAPVQNSATIAGRLAVTSTAPKGPVVIEQEPNSTDFQVQYIGLANTATRAEIYGHIGNDGTDDYDGFRFRSTAPMRVRVTLNAIEPTTTTNLDMFWFDATGIRLNQLIRGTSNPENGSFTVVSANLEFDVIVYAVNGSSGYSITVETAPLSGNLELEAGSEPAPQDALLRWRGAHWPMVEGEVVALLAPEAGGFGPSARAPFVAPTGLAVVTQSEDLVVLRELTTANFATSRDARALATCQAARELAKDSRVRAASPNYLCRAEAAASVRRILPSDEHLALQWNLPQIRATEAWDATRGSAEVTIAVLDTGIVSKHPDLKTRLVAGYDFVSDPARAGDGNGIDADAEEPARPGSAVPTTFHGSHVAGILGAATDNRDGIAGIDWLAKVMPIRVLAHDGTGTVADIAEGLRYVARLPNASGTLPAKRADVICMSFGTAASSPVLEAAINEARGSGAVLVAAAGNDGSANDVYPAAYPSCISVGATRVDRALARYSSSASTIDLVAPGGDLEVDQNGDGFPDGILSASSTDEDGYTYRFLAGTSAAAPQVAGTAALIKAANPSLTATEIELVLLASAQSLGVPPRGTFPFRLLDTYQAVIMAQSSVPTEPKLLADARSLDFGTGTNSVVVKLSNTAASRLITINSVKTWYAAGSGWLTTTLANPSPNLTATELRLDVNRSALPPGVYAAAAEIQAKDQYPVRVHVIVRVGDPGPIQEQVHVLLVDAASRKVVTQVDTDATKGFAFSFSRLAPGSYFVVAGTDRNANNFVGDQGEFYGAWPRVDEPRILTLEKDQSLGNIDFNVAAQTFGLSLGAHGYERLR